MVEHALSLGTEAYVHSLNSKQYEPLTMEELLKEYEDVFTGLGCLPGEYHIEVDPGIKPVQHAPRSVPVPLKSKLKESKASLSRKLSQQNGSVVL